MVYDYISINPLKNVTVVKWLTACPNSFVCIVCSKAEDFCQALLVLTTI